MRFARWLVLIVVLAGCDATPRAASVTPITGAAATLPFTTALPQPSATASPTPLAVTSTAAPAVRWVIDTVTRTRREVAVRSVQTLGGGQLAIETRSGAQSRWERLDGSLVDNAEDAVVQSPSGRVRAAASPSQGAWAVSLDGIARASMRWTAGAEIVVAPDDAAIARVEPTGPRNAVVLVRDIASGSDEVAGIIQCPCDARLKLRWSSSGRYLTYVDVRDRLATYRVAVYDRIARTSRSIVDRNVELLPGDLAFTASDDVRLGGVTLIRLADLSVVRDFPNALEIRAVDAHLVVMGYSEDSSAVITPTGEVIEQLPYAIGLVRFVGESAVAAVTDLHVTTSHNCHGVLIIAASLAGGSRCIAGATSPAIDASAKRIAVLRGLVVMVDSLGGGNESEVDTGPFRPDPWSEPALQWDESGRYLLTAPLLEQ